MEDDAVLDYIKTLTQQNDTVVHFMSDHVDLMATTVGGCFCQC